MDQLPSTSPSLSSNSPTPSSNPPSPMQPIPTQGNISVPQEPSNTLPIQERSIIKKIPIWLLIPIIFWVITLFIRMIFVFIPYFQFAIPRKNILIFISPILGRVTLDVWIFGLMAFFCFITNREISKRKKIPQWLITAVITWFVSLLIQMLFMFIPMLQLSMSRNNPQLFFSFIFGKLTFNIWVFSLIGIICYFTSKFIKTPSIKIKKIFMPILIIITLLPILPFLVLISLRGVTDVTTLQTVGMTFGFLFAFSLPGAVISGIIILLTLLVTAWRKVRNSHLSEKSTETFSS